MLFESLCGALNDSWQLDWQAMLDSLRGIHILVALAIAAVAYALLQAFKLRSSSGSTREQQTLPLPRLITEGILRPGASTRLRVFEGGRSESMAASVDVVDRRYVTVSTSPFDSPELKVGSTMELLLSTESAGFRCTGVIQSVRQVADRFILQITMPPWVERIQRRSHFRVRVNAGATVSVIDPPATSEGPHRAKVRDFSAGGMTLEVPYQPAIGAMLRVRTSIAQLGESSYELRVLRTTPVRSGRDNIWRAACEFLWMDNDTVDRLAFACQEMQREQRRRAC